MIFLNLQLVFLKRSLDNVSLDWSAKITPSCDCSVIATYNLSNLTNQRVYQELVYRKGLFKGMITGSAAHSLPCFLLFYFCLRALSIQRAQLSRSLEQATAPLMCRT